ncbi:MAG: peptidylprolyl isomerase [Marmoricola sp.]
MTARTKYLVVLFACLALVASGCGSSNGAGGSAKPSAKSSATVAPTPSATSSAPAKSGACSYLKSVQPPARNVKFPSAKPTRTGKVKVSIGTNFGNMTAALDAKNAPCAVNAFLSLAKQGYYDKTTCHRISVNANPPFHILQCGDPTATGSGGPGYQYAEELTGKETYPAGTLAMAKTQAPSSTGAQFFVNFDDTQLPPQYTVLGRLTPAGLKVVKKASAAALKGKPAAYDGAPATRVNLTTVK